MKTFNQFLKEQDSILEGEIPKNSDRSHMSIRPPAGLPGQVYGAGRPDKENKEKPLRKFKKK